MLLIKFWKIVIVIAFLFFCFNVNAQSDGGVDSAQISDTLKTAVKTNKELTSSEKYALKMLKNSYSVKSIMAQTNLEKKRIKEIKKEYLK